MSDPEHVIGVHLTAGLGVPTGDPAELEGLTDDERTSMERDGRAVRRRQRLRTVPGQPAADLAYGLHDSPVVQLAYLGAASMPINQTTVPTGVSHGGPEAFRRLAARNKRHRALVKPRER